MVASAPQDLGHLKYVQQLATRFRGLTRGFLQPNEQ